MSISSTISDADILSIINKEISDNGNLCGSQFVKTEPSLNLTSGINGSKFTASLRNSFDMKKTWVPASKSGKTTAVNYVSGNWIDVQFIYFESRLKKHIPSRILNNDIDGSIKRTSKEIEEEQTKEIELRRVNELFQLDNNTRKLIPKSVAEAGYADSAIVTPIKTSSDLKEALLKAEEEAFVKGMIIVDSILVVSATYELFLRGLTEFTSNQNTIAPGFAGMIFEMRVVFSQCLVEIPAAAFTIYDPNYLVENTEWVVKPTFEILGFGTQFMHGDGMIEGLKIWNLGIIKKSISNLTRLTADRPN